MINLCFVKLEELAKRSGVSARTVRYYVQRGLPSAPVFRGRDTTYREVHLLRLRAISRMQEHFPPLDAIESELRRASAEEIRKQGVQEVTASPPYREMVPTPLEDRWTRWEVAPGLEIHLNERADAITRALAEELRALAERRK